MAGARGVLKPGGLILVNLFLGWTLIGWLVALVWAVQGQTDDDVKASSHEEEARTARAVARALQAERARTSSG